MNCIILSVARQEFLQLQNIHHATGNDGRVNLNTVTGVLSLGAVSLDYEGDTSHTYTIGAYDNPGGIPSLDVSGVP